MEPLLLQNLQEMRQDIRLINEKLDDLGKWKSKVVGGSIAFSALLTLLIKLTDVYLNK